ncbi:MAG: preprotein translocase subunit SecA [Acidobacteria bacterium]|nr:preprotein translocase subunit SecA [Acidobacteriota bacterium]
MDKMLAKVFGTKNERVIKRLMPQVRAIGELEPAIERLSDTELAVKTVEFRRRLAAGETLEDLLVEAFAVVREAGRRTLNMRHFDVQLVGGMVLHSGKIAEMKTGEGKTLVATLAAYLNALEGKGVHIVTVNDYLARRDAEWMGKLYKSLGLSVGVIVHDLDDKQRQQSYACDITYGTNNEFGFDYLRDNMKFELNQCVQRGHHFAIVDEVDSILIDEARTPLIISGTAEYHTPVYYKELKPVVERLVNKQLALVSQLVTDAKKLLHGDESQFGSEGRTPQDDFAPGSNDDRELAAQKLVQAKRAAPKYKPLLELTENPEIKTLVAQFEKRVGGEFERELLEPLYFTVNEKNHIVDMNSSGRMQVAQALMDDLARAELAWQTEEIQENPNLSAEEKAAAIRDLQGNYDSFSILDVDDTIRRIESRTELSEEEKQHLIQRVPKLAEQRWAKNEAIRQLLKAYVLYEKDDEYVVVDNQVVIVDEFTGRMMPGRRWSDGLHEAVEAKEGVKIERQTQTFATITFQNYFRMYQKLAGMTGTAETEAAEFEKIYNLEVVAIPTNRPLRRHENSDVVYRTEREKYNAVVEEIRELHQRGQPVLVGTTSVEKSERLSDLLKKGGVRHVVLNAKQHAREAEIVAQAGRKGTATIATNMAGRGTDILLGGNPEAMAREVLRKQNIAPESATPEQWKQAMARFQAEVDKEHDEVVAFGGLHIIGTERHESRRVDNQLRGRAGRQGDPGSSRFYLSLEDDLMRIFASDRISSIMKRLGMEEGVPIESGLISRRIEAAQKAVEGQNFEARKHLLEYDDVMNKQRTAIYGLRRQLLEKEDHKEYILNLAETIVEELVAEHCAKEIHPDEWNLTGLRNAIFGQFGIDLRHEGLENARLSQEEWIEKLTGLVLRKYEEKEALFKPEIMRWHERMILLHIVDQQWKYHLLSMDDLKSGIGLRGYGQKDPLVEYKKESFQMFEAMMARIEEEVVRWLFLMQPVQEEEQVKEIERKQKKQEQDLILTGAEDGSATAPKTVVRSGEKVGRNEPCPCGSGKKYKKCHGAAA